MALAQFAGQTVAAAACTDVWETARHKVARLLGWGNPGKPKWWSAGWPRHASNLQLRRARISNRCAPLRRGGGQGRFADMLDEDPSVQAQLRAVVQQIAAQLPAGTVSAADQAVAAGRDVNITADRGGTAAGVIHGDVVLPGPTRPGPAAS